MNKRYKPIPIAAGIALGLLYLLWTIAIRLAASGVVVFLLLVAVIMPPETTVAQLGTLAHSSPFWVCSALLATIYSIICPFIYGPFWHYSPHETAAAGYVTRSSNLAVIKPSGKASAEPKKTSGSDAETTTSKPKAN